MSTIIGEQRRISLMICVMRAANAALRYCVRIAVNECSGWIRSSFSGLSEDQLYEKLLNTNMQELCQ